MGPINTDRGDSHEIFSANTSESYPGRFKGAVRGRSKRDYREREKIGGQSYLPFFSTIKLFLYEDLHAACLAAPEWPERMKPCFMIQLAVVEKPLGESFSSLMLFISLCHVSIGCLPNFT